MKTTPLSSLGEFKLIEHLTKDIKLHHASTKKGVGDDAAVFSAEGKQNLITTDLLVEGIHFDLTYTPLKHLGYKAVVVNLSDIYAMNGEPRLITVSLSVSNRFSLEALEELYAGMHLACAEYKVDLVGGDTTSSQQGLTISITAIGVAESEKIAYRNTAKENQLICVSGDLGAAYLGLQLLEREKEIFRTHPEVQPQLQDYSYVLQRQLKPEARRDIVRFLAEKNIVPTAMIDISDGLSSEILHLCKQSNLGCKIFEEKIPIAMETQDAAKEFKLDPTICALSGGEDYELLFSIQQADYETIKQHNDIAIIGHFTTQKKGVNLIARDGTAVPMRAQGWNAMKEAE